MPTRTIEYTDDTYSARVIVSSATIESSTRRSVLQVRYSELLKSLHAELQKAKDAYDAATTDDARDAATTDLATLQDRIDRELDDTVRYLRTVVYPDFMAATTAGKFTITTLADEPDQPPTVIVWSYPLTFEQFITLPEAPDFDARWRSAVYELNRRWLRVPDEAEDKAQKKD